MQETWEADYWHLLAVEKRRVWWIRGWWPGIGVSGDEYQRRTLFVGPLVIALWRCRCVECRTELEELRARVDGE